MWWIFSLVFLYGGARTRGGCPLVLSSVILVRDGFFANSWSAFSLRWHHLDSVVASRARKNICQAVASAKRSCQTAGASGIGYTLNTITSSETAARNRTPPRDFKHQESPS